MKIVVGKMEESFEGRCPSCKVKIVPSGNLFILFLPILSCFFIRTPHKAAELITGLPFRLPTCYCVHVTYHVGSYSQFWILEGCLSCCSFMQVGYLSFGKVCY